MRTRWSAPFALTGLLAWIAIAAAADPATQPAPHKAQVPPGFHVLAIGDRAVFCAGGDDVWVKPVLESVPAATRPATMPSDVVSALQQRRSELATQILQDLALDDRKAVDEFIDGKLLAALAKVGAMKPSPLIYQRAIEAAGCRPAECFFTDDIPAYVEGAKQQGIDAVPFQSAAQVEKELRKRGVTWNDGDA